jgi:hypothetical protein
VVEEVAGAVARLGRIVHLAHAERLGNGNVGRERVDLAAAARGGDVAAGDEHPRPFDLAGIDRVTQRDVREAAVDPHVAHRREAALKLDARGLRAFQDRIRLAMLERLGRVVGILLDRAVGEMGVEVDQPGKDGVGRPVDRRRTMGVAPRRHRGDLAVDNADSLVGQHLRARGVDQPPGVDIDSLSCRSGGAQRGDCRQSPVASHLAPPFVSRKQTCHARGLGKTAD